MKKTHKYLRVLLTVALILGLTCSMWLSAQAEAKQAVALTADEKQAVFDAWFTFLYEDYITPFNKRYDSYEKFKADESKNFSLDNVAIDCYDREDGVYIVTVEHREISCIDLFWLESAGGYVFDFSGVNQALWVYKDGKLRYFKDAYEDGLVSQNALLNLAASYPNVVRAGDMDRNGRLEVSDIIALRSEIAKGRSDASSGVKNSREGAYGDMDGDGKLTVSDVVALRTLIVAGA